MKKSITSGILITLAIHSCCCVLPLISFMLGMSSAFTYLDFLHPYELYINALSCVLIIVGFYIHYLHKSKSDCGHQHCKTDSGKTVYLITSSISILIMLWSVINH